MRDEWVDLNRRWWDERAPVHVASEFYDVGGFLSDPGSHTLQPFELAELGDVRGRTLVHPQCHFGLDTLSWARQGAQVTGLDFSAPAVSAARDVADRAGLDAEFVHANVYDAVEALDGRTFDVVYTGRGAINWLPDIERWARVMAALTAPGGTFYLTEFHPVHAILGDDDLTVAYPYFHDRDRPLEFDEAGTYAQPGTATADNRTVEWIHGLGAIFTALVDAGLTVELFHEFDYTLFSRWPFLVRDERGAYRLPEGTPSLPLMFSLRARKTS